MKKSRKNFEFTGFPDEHVAFDPNDPHSAIAERERKAMLDRLLVAITMNADKEIASMSFSGVMMGSMTGIAQGVIAHFNGNRKELEGAFLAIAKETFFMAYENEATKEQLGGAARDRTAGQARLCRHGPPQCGGGTLMTALQCFAFDDCLVRVTDETSTPRFIAADICRAIGIKDVSDAVERLDEDEKGRALIPTLGGEQEVLVVTESGLYTLVLRSRAATTQGSPAHRFRKWVTAEVLPAIRKTGTYAAPAADEGAAVPVSVAEDRIKLDKLHYAIRCFGPAVGRDLWLQLGLDYVPSMAGAKFTSKPLDLTLASFAEEKLMRRPNVLTAANIIYNAYKDWCAETGSFVMSQGGFGKAMTRLGFDKTKSNHIYYRGIALKPAEMSSEA